MKRPPAEFQLAVECCRAAFTGEDAPRIRQMSAVVDWDRFILIASFHRVQGLIWHALWSSQAEVPPQAASTLSNGAEAIVTSNLCIAIEARDLRSEFEKAGLKLLFVKGLAVGALVYAKPLLKMGWDIDVLIAPEQLSGAADVLRSRGYRLVIPAASADLERWHSRLKESVWTREPGLHVELHTRLADNRLLIPSIDVHSPRQMVQVMPGVELPTLAGDPLFAYLCVHGASSAWFRLKWIADLAGLIAPCLPAEIERLYDQSQSLGAGRAADQALLLADALFGSLEGISLSRRLKREPVSRWLAAAAYRQLAGNDGCRDPTEAWLGTARIHLTQLPLMSGARFAVNEFGRQIADITWRSGRH